MGKKKIEELFQDAFRDFGEVPHQRVWEALEVSLDKGKKRSRVVPIWWMLGGAAATLAILLYALAPFGPGSQMDLEQIITDLPEEQHPSPQRNQGFPPEGNNPQSGEALVGGDSRGKAVTAGERRVGNPKGADHSGRGREIGVRESPQGSTANTTEQDPGETSELAHTAPRKTLDSAEEGVPNSSPMGEPQTGGNALAQGGQNTGKAFGEPETGTKGEAAALALEQAGEDGKKSIFDAIREMEQEDGIAAIETSKWSVGPSVAPVYFDASGEGSPINSEFSTNAKTGNFNLSYGLSVAYEVGRRVKIRTGIHKVKYGYDTNDVAFSTSLTATTTRRSFDNIAYNRNSRGIIVESRSLGNSQGFLDSPSLASKEVTMNDVPVLDGKMVQQLGYIEVPLEVNYAVVDKKFGVDLIGGVSSLFLVDNSVLLESESLVTEMGEAKNANDLNFSANVGMGLNYKFSPKVQMHLEPMFKYQLNTFSETAGNFRPYSLGIYSGVSFKF